MSNYGAGVGAQGVLRQTYSLLCSSPGVRVLGEFSLGNGSGRIHAELCNGDTLKSQRPVMDYQRVRIVEFKDTGWVYALAPGNISMSGPHSEYCADILAVRLRGKNRRYITQRRLEALISTANVDFKKSVICALANGKLVSRGRIFGEKVESALNNPILRGRFSPPIYSKLSLLGYGGHDSSLGCEVPASYDGRFAEELAPLIEKVLVTVPDNPHS